MVGLFVSGLLLSLWAVFTATPAWAACPNGSSAPCAEDVQLNGCIQCHSIRVTGGNRNGTDRTITESTGSQRHIDDPRASDWTGIVDSMIKKGAPADSVLTSGYLNTNYCTNCNAAILGSPVPSSVTETTATITWSTSANGFEDELTDTVLFYGTNQSDVLLGPGCSSCTTVSDSTPVAHHVVNLTGLTSNTKYYLVNQATSSRGTVRSTYAVSFKTKALITGGIPSRVYFSNNGGKTGPATIGVIDPATNTLITSISMEGTTYGEVAPSPDGSVVYALDPGNANLLALDVLTNTIVGKALKAGTNLVAVSPDGSKAYVTQRRQINVIGTGGMVVIDNISTTCSDHLGLGVHPSGSPLYLWCGDTGKSSQGYFYLINPVTKVVTLTYTTPCCFQALLSQSNFLAMRPDGQRVYAVKNNTFNDTIEIFDGTTGAQMGAITLPASGGDRTTRTVVVSPDGSRLYTSNKSGLHVIDTATNSILFTVGSLANMYDIAVTPDGKRLYATDNGTTVYVMDTLTNTVTNTITGSAITAAGPLTVSPGRAGAAAPDLVMDSLTPNGASADVGQTLSVTDTVKSQGPVSTGGSFTIAYRLSPTANYDDPGAVVVPTIRSVGTLASGASDTITTSLLIPAATPGLYYVCAKADSLDDIAENNETNNSLCSTSRVQINRPDLIMTQELPQASAVQVGQTLLVTDTVQNQGGASTGSSFTIAYRLSPTANYDDPNAKAIPTIRFVGTLAAGASDTASRALLIPGTVAPGSYYVCAKADPADTVSETNENNNTRCSDLTVSVQ